MNETSRDTDTVSPFCYFTTQRAMMEEFDRLSVHRIWQKLQGWISSNLMKKWSKRELKLKWDMITGGWCFGCKWCAKKNANHFKERRPLRWRHLLPSVGPVFDCRNMKRSRWTLLQSECCKGPRKHKLLSRFKQSWLKANFPSVPQQDILITIMHDYTCWVRNSKWS